MNHDHCRNGKLYERHEFDLLSPSDRTQVEMSRARLSEIDDVWQLAAGELPTGIATAAVIHDVQEGNKNSVLVFKRNGQRVGLCAMLMLSAQGMEGLLLGELDRCAPDHASLVDAMSKPAAIYMWALVSPGRAVDGLRHLSRFLRQPMYRDVTMFSCPNTVAGVRLNLALGFRPLASHPGGLYRYVRLVNRPAAVAQAA